MAVTIDKVRPKVWYRSYSNEMSQGSLIRATAEWPNARVPKGCKVGSAYIDRMETWDREKFHQMVVMMGGTEVQQCGIDRVVDDATEEQLLAAAKFYFDEEVIAVRWVYYYNAATGYPCERVDYMFRSRVLGEHLSSLADQALAEHAAGETEDWPE